MVSQVSNAAWLDWMNALMQQPASVSTHAKGLDVSCYHCLLAEQPSHLLTRRDASQLTSPPAGLQVNPQCVFTRDAELPRDFSPELVVNFAREGTIAWVPRQGRGWSPFWLGEDLGYLFKGVQPGDAEPTHLSAWMRTLLVSAGILIHREDAEPHQRRWEESMDRAKLLVQRGFAPLPNLLHPFHIAALRRYYRQQVRTGRVQLGDDQSPRRYIAHNESVARYFHHQLTETVRELVGEPVKPSYVYFSSYLGGAELEKHLDRPQCEFSLTLQLDYAPEPSNATPWPLYLDIPEGKVTVHQAIGDALFYRGHQIPHYRSPLPRGHVSSHIFFHYVREAFEGPLR